MSDKDRKKKDGQDTNKKNQRMRETVQERQENAAPEGASTDEVDVVKFKSGSPNDRVSQDQAS